MIESVIMLLLGWVNQLCIDVICTKTLLLRAGVLLNCGYVQQARSGDVAAERLTHSILTVKAFVG